MQLGSPVVPNPGVGPYPKGHKINLGGCEMINGIGKKESSAKQICIYILDFSPIFAFLVNYWMSLHLDLNIY